MQVASHRVGLFFVLVIPFFATAPAQSPNVAEALIWKGHEWVVTNGAMAGWARGSSHNVLIDPDGSLHLRITKLHGVVTAGEVFSKNDFGFGTFQWEIQGRIDHMDPAAVLGLFLYGPAHKIGVDGQNELDIEFSKWRKRLCHGKCNADVAVYPASASLGRTEDDFELKVHRKALTTARLEWLPTRVTATIMRGMQPIGKKKDVLYTWTFAPRDYRARIPQQAMPIGMNLWCFRKRAAHHQEVIIRDFQFIPGDVKEDGK